MPTSWFLQVSFRKERGAEVTAAGLGGPLSLENIKGSEIKQVESSWVTFRSCNRTGYKHQTGVQAASSGLTERYLK